MRNTLPGDCVAAMKKTLRAAGLAATVQYSFRPRFKRADVAETRIFISPTASETDRITRKRVTESPAFEVALVRALPEGDVDYIKGNKDLDSHSLDGMFDLQTKLIAALWETPGVVLVSPETGPDNDMSNDGVWFTLYRVQFEEVVL